MDLVASIQNFFTSPQFTMFLTVLKVFTFVFFFIALPTWTYTDAEKRGAYSSFWAAVTLFFPFFGWLIYILMRPREYIDEVRERELEIQSKQALIARTDVNCPSCHKPVENSFLICPYCRKKLKKQCPSCERALNLSWGICPYCKRPQKITPTKTTKEPEEESIFANKKLGADK